MATQKPSTDASSTTPPHAKEEGVDIRQGPSREPSTAIRLPSSEGPWSNTRNSFQEIAYLPQLAMNFLTNPIPNLHWGATNVSQFVQGLCGRSFDPSRDVIDQTGKVILITGGNTGLGKEAVLQLAKHKPSRIYLCARTESKARNAIASIESSLDFKPDIRYIQLDLASFRSIRTAAEKFLSDCDRLDTLILNAGIMAFPPDKTEDGFEIQFGTNYIGHFLLVKLLLPTLLKTANAKSSPSPDVRVISVSSLGYQFAPSSFSDMTSTSKLCASNTWVRYGASKTGNILLASELARRHPEVMSVSLHPGIINTGLFETLKGSNAFMRYGVAAITPFLTSEKTGTLNHLWTAGVEREKLVNGEYYIPVGVRGWKNPYVHDLEMGKKLWEWAEEQVDT